MATASPPATAPSPAKATPTISRPTSTQKGYHYRVVNEGISGNTTKDGVERVDTIVAMKPAIVVVEFGGNDGLRGFRIEDSRANLDKIVATLKASGAKIVLAGITLPPDYGPDYIKQFNETYTLLAKKYNVPLLPVPPERRLRRRRHDAGRQHPRHRRGQQDRREKRPPPRPPAAQKIGWSWNPLMWCRHGLGRDGDGTIGRRRQTPRLSIGQTE